MKANGTPAPKPEERPGINIVIADGASLSLPARRCSLGADVQTAAKRMLNGMRGLHRGFAYA